MKLWGAGLLLAPLPFQYVTVPRVAAIRAQIEKEEGLIADLEARSARIRIRWDEDGKKLKEIVGSGKNQRIPSFNITEFNDALQVQQESGAELSSLDRDIRKGRDIVDHRLSEILRIEGEVRNTIFRISLFGGLLAFLGAWWEIERKVRKDYREEKNHG